MMSSKLILVLQGASSEDWRWLTSYGTGWHHMAPLGKFVLILQLVAGEHGLFGAHESEDIQTILYNICSTIVIVHS